MLIFHKGHTDTIQVYSVTVMTHVKALQAGHSSQGTSEPITPVTILQSSSSGITHSQLGIYYRGIYLKLRIMIPGLSNMGIKSSLIIYFIFMFRAVVDRRDIHFRVVRLSVHLPVRHILTGTTSYSTYLINRLPLYLYNGRSVQLEGCRCAFHFQV